jgi:enediyne biosynthesis protein E4
MRTQDSACSRLRWLAVAVLAVHLSGCREAGIPSTDNSSPALSSPRAPGSFRDISSSAGIAFQHDYGGAGKFLFVETTPGGCAFLDYDQDGKLDLFLVQSGPVPGTPSTTQRPHCSLYRSVGTAESPRFEDVSKGSGLGQDFGYVQGAAVADYDNDGYPDLFLTAYGGNHLLHNNRQGSFTDVTRSSGLDDLDEGARWAASAAWGDFDNDGKLDLYVCHYCRWSVKTDLHCVNRNGARAYCTPTQYEPDSGRLYRNEGTGRFRDVTAAAGLKKKGRGLGAIWLDYDSDGRQDLYVANDLNPNFLFHNDGNGQFTEVGLEAGAAVSDRGETLSGMGVAAGDVNADGREDLYVTNFSAQTNSLYLGEESGFRYATTHAGLAGPTHARLGWGTGFFDFDLDGHPDIVIGNGHVNPDVDQTGLGTTYAEPKGLFRNKGDGTFEDALTRAGDMNNARVTRGLALGDINNDGRPDVLANNHGERAELFLNVDANRNHWLAVRLVGTVSNRDGIGARVRVSAKSRVMTSVCRRSSSYCSSNDPTLLFGLADSAAIDAIEIRWPSGRIERHVSLAGAAIAADQRLVAEEGKGLGIATPAQ